uniref:E3 SUMO-protein ligase KIAA1586-like n=1 Tax=Myxine glutinosa TaxID=7769 RepID=UPI00358F1FC4
MYSETKSTDAFAFPLELIELESLSAESITNNVLSTLDKHTFTEAYLKKNLVGVCADGASTMVGKKSGVMTRLQERFPNIIIWHCMCHRLELAVGDAVDSVTAVNHIKIFIDKLYSLYNTSPKARRKLEECAKELETQVLQMKRVLDTRWTPSSFRALRALWNNYKVLHKHFTDESNTGKSNTETATYSGLKATLETDAFIHSLAVMLDAISEISELSLILQSESTTIVKAYQAVKRTIRALAQQKDQDGENELSERTDYPYYTQYVKAMQEDSFKGVMIQEGRRRQPKLNKNAFLQSSIDNLSSRLECNVASQRQCSIAEAM